MATNKIAVRTVEEFMAGYTPVYSPILPLFISGKSQEYAQETGVLNLKSAETIGDIRARHITPKDTEIKQINFREGSKSFKKYFLANQFKISQFQDDNGVDDVITQVLDEHWKHADDLLLLGEGTAANNVVNNGLYWSGDANYILESSVAVAAGTDSLIDLHARIITTKLKADLLSGRKMLILYGDTVLAKASSLFVSNPNPFIEVLKSSLGSNYEVVLLPSAVTPASAAGWIIVNMDQIKLHYTTLPGLNKSGSNDEKDYDWYNFLMGSMMLEVKAYGAVIRQPATFA